MKTINKLLIFTFIFWLNIHGKCFSQTILLGPQAFNSDVLVHGTTAPTNVWFAPDYNTPISFISSDGCDDGCVGYSGSWNNYWANFLRTPQLNCDAYDTVFMSFDLSNSYSSSHNNDKVYFNMWIEGAYHNATTNQTILFDQARNCTHFEVAFNLTPFTNKNVMFYLNASCNYNDAQNFFLKFDNICIYTSLNTGAEKTTSNETFNIFPNPAQDYIYVDIPSYFEATVTLQNTLGAPLETHKFKNNKQIIIPIYNLKKGIYLLYISTNKQNVLKKIIKI